MYRKYHNKKITIDGLTFDSKKEARRYQELKALEKAGVIYGLRTQVKYLLIPAQHELTDEVYIKGKNKGDPKKGKLLERECAYYADFVYMQGDNTIVEDVKGYRDGQAYNLFVIKRKLMLYVHGIIVKEL